MSDELTTLRERLVDATKTVSALAPQQRAAIERSRLHGKAEGLRLATAYLDEALRQPAERATLRERVAAVEALADEWERDEGILSADSRYTRDVLLRELRAALTFPGTALAKVRADVLRDMAVAFTTDAARAWGEGATWITSGNRVAVIAAEWCHGRADEIEREAGA